MNKKGFYVALLAAFAIAAIAGTIILSASSAKTENNEIYAKEIPEVKRIWQNSRLAIDDLQGYTLYITRCQAPPGIFNATIVNANLHHVLDDVNRMQGLSCNFDLGSTKVVSTGGPSPTYTITIKLNCKRIFGIAANPDFSALFENKFDVIKTVQDEGVPASCKIIDAQSGKLVYPCVIEGQPCDALNPCCNTLQCDGGTCKKLA